MTDQQLAALEDAVQKAPKGQEANAAKQWADQNKEWVDKTFTGL